VYLNTATKLKHANCISVKVFSAQVNSVNISVGNKKVRNVKYSAYCTYDYIPAIISAAFFRRTCDEG